MLSQRNKIRISIVFAAVALGIIVLLLFINNYNVTVSKSITAYNDNQNLLADVMVKAAVTETQKNNSNMSENIISLVKEKYSTSSSMYCIVAKNDKIVFLKDENNTSRLNNETISSYFSKDNVSTKDKQKYIISKAVEKYNGDNYTLLICTGKDYFINKANLYTMRFYYLGYFIIYEALLLIIIIFLFYKLHSEENNKAILENEIKNNRMVIEKLEDFKKQFYSENESEYCFYDREIVEEVILSMKDEEKNSCIKIDIFVEKLKMEYFILITDIIGKMKVQNSISCYWEDNQFIVLLFNSDKEKAQEFINIFISKFNAESKENAEVLKVIAGRLQGGSY